MRRLIILFIFIISCPRPQIKAIPEPDYIREAERSYKDNPLYAYSLLKNLGAPSASWSLDHARIMLEMYMDQREYRRAEILLDSVGWAEGLPADIKLRVAVNAGRWDKVQSLTADMLLKGIACYHLSDYGRAAGYLLKADEPEDFRVLYLARVHYALGNYDSALAALAAIDSVKKYLSDQYQDLLFDILIAASDPAAVTREIGKLKDESLRDYVLLKIREKQQRQMDVHETAWRLIRKYPRSAGAFYALALVKASTAADHKACGKVYYYHGKYDGAIRHFQQIASDSDINYFLGKIAYDRGLFAQALNHFRRSSWIEAQYYRGRIHEDQGDLARAIVIYDSLHDLHKDSRYAVRALKRKAFLLEDAGDTLSAVRVFLQVKERATRFRAAMQLYRLGRLDEVVSVLDDTTEPSFIYWQIRARERLGRSTEDLQSLLSRRYPLSYYSLFKNNRPLAYDSLPLYQWSRQWGDTVVTFDHEDSLHIGRAVRYFFLNDMDAAASELNAIEDMSVQDLLYLMFLCRLNGADRLSVNYGLKVKALAEKRGVREFPKEFMRGIYPVRYAFSIMETASDPILTLALIWQESLFDPRATSTADARGLMQIIPSTGRLVARDLGVVDYSLYEPETSIRFGTHYFDQVTKDFRSAPLALAAYNAGPVRVKKWLAQDPNAELDEFIELIPYSETQNYVKLIMARQIIYRNLYGGYDAAGD